MVSTAIADAREAALSGELSASLSERLMAPVLFYNGNLGCVTEEVSDIAWNRLKDVGDPQGFQTNERWVEMVTVRDIIATEIYLGSDLVYEPSS